jgi:AcrR family transcriptional regulator
MSPGSQNSERARICEAMIGLCGELQYPNVTMPDLLERASVDEVAFGRHFGDLEDCFCQIFEAQRDEIVRRVVGAFAAEQGWRNQMRAAAYAMLYFLGEDLRRARFISVEVLYAGDRAKLIRDQGMQGFFLLIDQGRNEMADPESLTPYTAETIGSAIYQRIQTAIETDELEEFESAVPEMMYMAVLPYLGPEAAQEELSIPPTPFPSR